MPSGSREGMDKRSRWNGKQCRRGWLRIEATSSLVSDPVSLLQPFSLLGLVARDGPVRPKCCDAVIRGGIGGIVRWENGKLGRCVHTIIARVTVPGDHAFLTGATCTGGSCREVSEQGKRETWDRREKMYSPCNCAPTDGEGKLLF